MNQSWPVAELDPIRRLRVLAETLPGTTLVEIVVPAPIERVWTTAADLESSMLVLVRDFRQVRTFEADGRLRMDARGRFGQRARFDVELRPGWCWMQSRLWVGGLAAAPADEPGLTRIGFLGGVRLPGAGLVARPLRRTTSRLGREALLRLATRIESGTGGPAVS